jgi:hypothetical protein
MAKSVGSDPRTRHCIASKLAIRSTVLCRSELDAAWNFVSPLAFSQNTKELR